MAEKLGIVVSSDEHLDHLIGLCQAVRRSGRETIIFLTNRGVLLTQNPKFTELAECPDISLCNVNFEAFKLERPAPLIDEKKYATQARHAMLIEDCDRYVVL